MKDEHKRIKELPLKVKLLMKLVIALLEKLDDLLEPHEMCISMAIMGKDYGEEGDDAAEEAKNEEFMQ